MPIIQNILVIVVVRYPQLLGWLTSAGSGAAPSIVLVRSDTSCLRQGTVCGHGPVLTFQPQQSHGSKCPTISGARVIFLLQIIGDKVNIFHKRYTVQTIIFYPRFKTVILLPHWIRRLSISSILLQPHGRIQLPGGGIRGSCSSTNLIIFCILFHKLNTVPMIIYIPMIYI